MRKHILALDGVRGVAILLVLFTHLLPYRVSGELPLRLLNGMAGIGWIGVNLFFVLSGFLITGILYDSKENLHFFRNFYLRRTLRICPVYFLLVGLCCFVFPHFNATSSAEPGKHQWMYWLYLTNIRESFLGGGDGWLGPLWSLAVEEHFYLVWPAVIYLASRISSLRICFLCVVIANISRIWFVTHGNVIAPYAFTLSRIDDLALGSLVALGIRGPIDVIASRKLAIRIAIVTGVTTFVLTVWKHGMIVNPTIQLFGLPAVGVLCASILTLVVLPGSAGRLALFFEYPLLRTFGTYSYGLYMYHVGVSALMHHFQLLLPVRSRLDDLLNTALLICVSFAVAFTSFHLLEKPFLRLKRFFPERPLRGSSSAAQCEGGMPSEGVSLGMPLA